MKSMLKKVHAVSEDCLKMSVTETIQETPMKNNWSQINNYKKKICDYLHTFSSDFSLFLMVV